MKRVFLITALIALFGLASIVSEPVQATSSTVGQRLVVFEGFYNPG